MKHFLFFLLLCVGEVFSADYSLVYGIVTDSATGDTLPGVNYGLSYVQPNGSSRTTDSNGVYYVVMFPPKEAPPDSEPNAIRARMIPASKPFEIRNESIVFNLEKSERIEIAAYAISGRRVAGYSADWGPGTHIAPSLVRATGVFIYRIRIGRDVYVRKFTLFPPGISGSGSGTAQGSPALAKAAAADLRGYALYFAKSGYYDKQIPILDTGLMMVSLRAVALLDGVRPGRWDFASDQGKDMRVYVAAGGKSIDSVRMTLRRGCQGPDSSLAFAGPLPIPRNGVVTLGGFLEIDFLETSATAFIELRGVDIAPCDSSRVYFNTARVTLTITGSRGKVTRDPDQPFYLPGQRVNLLAIPEDSLTGFRHWSGVPYQSEMAYPYDPRYNPITVFLNKSVSIDAHFALNFILSLPAKNGTVMRLPAKTAYSPGDTVYLYPTPDDGYRFKDWSGPILKDYGYRAMVVMDTDKNIVANFQRVHRLDVDVEHAEWRCDPDVEYDRVAYGNGGRQIAYIPAAAHATIKVVASPDSQFNVTGWGGDTLRASRDSAWVLMDTSKTISITTVAKALVKTYAQGSALGDGRLLVASPDGKTVAIADNDSILLWDMAADKHIRTLPNSVAWSLDFTPDGKYFVTANFTGEARVFDLMSGTGLALIHANVSAAAASPDNATAAIGGDSIWIFQLDYEKKIAAYPRLWNSQVARLIYSPDGSRLAYTCSNGVLDSIAVLDVKTGAVIRRLHGAENFPVAFTPDGNGLQVIGDQGSSISVFEIATGKTLSTLPLGFGTGYAAFSPDRKLLAFSGSKFADLKIMDLAAGQVIFKAPPVSGYLGNIAFTADSKQLLQGYGNFLLLNFR